MMITLNTTSKVINKKMRVGTGIGSVFWLVCVIRGRHVPQISSHSLCVVSSIKYVVDQFSYNGFFI